jgi:hypothetical protein
MATKGFKTQEVTWLQSRGKELRRSASLGGVVDTAEAAE